MKDVLKAHCNGCGRDTNNEVLARERRETLDDDGHVDVQTYEMLKCLGCDGISFRDSWQPYRDTPPRIRTYPPATLRRQKDWTNELLSLVMDFDVPEEVCALMQEVYIAAQNDTRKLAAIGIRATLESVMVNKVGDHGAFSKNLDELQQAGYVSVNARGTLNSLLEAEHAAIHRGWTPSNQEVVTLIDITESIVEEVYLHGSRAAALEENIPKRNKAKQPRR